MARELHQIADRIRKHLYDDGFTVDRRWYLEMLSDYLQPLPQPPNENIPFSVFPVYTGPTTPALSTDDQGNVVVGAPLVTSSFAAPTGASTVNFTTGVIVGGTHGFPPSSGNVANEIPLHGTLGLAQAQSVLGPHLESRFLYDQ